MNTNQVKRFSVGEYGAYDWISFRRELLELTEINLRTNAGREDIKDRIHLLVQGLDDANDDSHNEWMSHLEPSKYVEGRAPIYWRMYAIWSLFMQNTKDAAEFKALGKTLRGLMEK